MGKLLKILIVIGIAVAAWIIYVDFTEKRELKKQQALKSQQATETTGEVQSITTAQPQPSSASPGLRAITPAPRPASSPSHYQQVLAAAKDTGVTILSYQEKGNEATIYCKAGDRNNLGDFLDALVDRGIIRDTDLDKKKFQQVTDRQLRWHFYATYVVKF